MQNIGRARKRFEAALERMYQSKGWAAQYCLFMRWCYWLAMNGFTL